MVLKPLTLIGTTFSMVTGVALGVLVFHRLYAEQTMQRGEIDEVMRYISTMYVEDVSEGQLTRDAIAGMLSGLDPHTSFLNRDAHRLLQDDTSGHFTGIGIEIGLVDGFFTVISPIDQSPASEAGLQSGDRLLAVDGVSLKGRRLNQVVRRLRGRVGSDVQLRLKRAEEPPYEVTVQRAVINTPTVTARLAPS